MFMSFFLLLVVQNLESDQPVSTGPLTECLYCNKKYSLSEIQDHVDVCEK